MTIQLHERDWTEVHKALDAYHAHDAAYERVSDEAFAMNNMDGSAHLQAWLDKLDELKLACGMAFVEATSDINSRHHGSVVGLDFVEKCSAYVPKNKRVQS